LITPLFPSIWNGKGENKEKGLRKIEGGLLSEPWASSTSGGGPFI